MNSNTYLVSGKGFYAGNVFKYDTEYHNKIIGQEHLWVDNIRNAKPLSGKSARKIQENFDFPTFLWNPFKEEPIKEKWEVVQRSSEHDFFNDEYHKVLEWRAIKVVHESMTDVKYLSNKASNRVGKVYYNEDDAKNIAKTNNLVMLSELIDKINNQG
jgi:hypothetical protein